MAVFHFGEQQHRACLRHGFHHQHAGHDGIFRKMSLKERLVDGDIFNGDNALFAPDLNNAIEQQKGIAVRQNRHDLLDVERAAGGRLVDHRRSRIVRVIHT